jgi:hypothetical protein
MANEGGCASALVDKILQSALRPEPVKFLPEKAPST